jgi:hypothetical protein
LTVILQISAALPLHSAVVARLEAAPARCSVPHSFTRHFNPPQQQPMEGPEKGIRASARADGGGRFFFKIRFARCAREFKLSARTDTPALIEALGGARPGQGWVTWGSIPRATSLPNLPSTPGRLSPRLHPASPSTAEAHLGQQLADLVPPSPHPTPPGRPATRSLPGTSHQVPGPCPRPPPRQSPGGPPVPATEAGPH